MKEDKGKILELIVSELERSISDNPTTSIKLRHKVIDRDGFDREIDVYVETKVNKKTLRYAIECKNYGENSKVKMSHIDEFYSKIANQGMKGIFLTAGKFQKNAIKKAKKLNIELYSIENNDESFIQKYYLFNKRFQVINVELGSPHLQEFNDFELTEVYMGEPKNKWTFQDYSEKYMKVEIERTISQNIGKLFKDFLQENENGFTWILGEKKNYFIFGNLHHVFFKREEKFYPIEHFRSKVELWIDFIQRENPTGQSYKSIETGETFANFLSQRVRMNDNKMGLFNIIQIEGEEDYKFTFMTGDEEIDKRINLVELAKFSDLEIRVDEK